MDKQNSRARSGSWRLRASAYWISDIQVGRPTIWELFPTHKRAMPGPMAPTARLNTHSPIPDEWRSSSIKTNHRALRLAGKFHSKKETGDTSHRGRSERISDAASGNRNLPVMTNLHA